ncbi:hypothetical protein ZYGR_0H04730 [Zygosaccharomyces rouxii]|uniref:C2H2-type domain-containing protein n=1 Tax=Zygosaccharomyces rouxii TaxID=4956 RepID=A0A1Q2ZVY6_ZYGRO|nr:hypothetical protein ZYGR_0H04730 [Zygosaccharomyces rouxii]
MLPNRADNEKEGGFDNGMTVSTTMDTIFQDSGNVPDVSPSSVAVASSSEDQNSPSLMLPIPKKSRTIKTDKPRPFLCSICTRGFVRQEHLKRHQRSHTNEKPFLCVFCGRCFARRDLVLRHQHKLHAALVSKTLEEDVMMDFSEAGDNNSTNINGNNEPMDKNIIKVTGNKESILPTPSNPMAKTTAQLKKAAKQAAMNTSASASSTSSSSSSTTKEATREQAPPKRRKRHASFSASSAFSYVNDSSSSQVANREMEPQEGPHQVGFSTPQLTAQQLMEKAVESGVVDVGLLGLPPDFNLDDDSHTSPLTNFLTLGSGGGTGGFARLDTGSDSNLMPFQPQDLLHNPQEHQELQDQEHQEHQEPQQHQQQHEFFQDSQQWLPDFISSAQLEPNFKVNLEHINDVGFADAPSTASVTPHSNLYNLSIQPQNLPESVIASQSPNLSPRSNQSPASNNTHNSMSLGPSVSALFKWRQKDLFDESYSLFSSPTKPTSSSPSPEIRDTLSQYKKFSRLSSFTEEYRSKIIADNNLTSNLFPTVDELNSYLNLYQYEFHRYFPFVHLHSLVPTMDNYPLLLSVSMIGALYAFHSSHGMLLSNISWRCVKTYLENTRSNYESTPLWLIQSMVLLTFLGIFSNDSSVTKSMKSRIMTMINLVKITKLNLPLENFENPPIESDHVYDYQDNPEILSQIRAQYSNPEQNRKNYEYFIKAQARIRTCHTILLISNLFTSLVGLDCSLHSINLKCGVPCYYDNLYLCENVTDWSEHLKKYRLVLDSKFSLIHLANGCEDYGHCLMYISTGSQYYFENSKVSFKTLLSMLISIHEKIYMERSQLSDEDDLQMIEVKWRMSSRPVIESMLKYWEALYIKNGGILTRNRDNIPTINESPSMRLIIPLHLFANIRKCINICPVMNKAWIKDWKGMNEVVDSLCYDMESLREATNYALDIVDFWADTVSVMKNAERTALRTPIFSITCMFSSILIVSEYMKRVEAWAQEFDLSNLHSPIINASDRLLWLKSEKILKKIEQHLLPTGYNLQSYSEFLRVQAKGALDVEVLDNELAQRAVRPDTPMAETAAVITRARLSTRSLYLGVRILGDAPIWPIALLFAHVLQARAIYNEDRKT